MSRKCFLAAFVLLRSVRSRLPRARTPPRQVCFLRVLTRCSSVCIKIRMQHIIPTRHTFRVLLYCVMRFNMLGAEEPHEHEQHVTCFLAAFVLLRSVRSGLPRAAAARADALFGATSKRAVQYVVSNLISRQHAQNLSLRRSFRHPFARGYPGPELCQVCFLRVLTRCSSARFHIHTACVAIYVLRASICTCQHAQTIDN